MRTVVFRAPSGCANKIAPQFQPHRPLTSYLLGLRPMNAPPRGIFSIAPPIGAPFFMFGGIGLPPLRGPITGDAIGLRGPLPFRMLLVHEGCYSQEVYWSHCRRRYWLTACPSIRHWANWYSGGGIGLPPTRAQLTGGAIGPRGPLDGLFTPSSLGERGLLGFLIRMVYPIIFCIV
jgi:hypothetical protein